MTHDDDLDPSIVESLRRMPDSESARDARIHAALDEMSPRRKAPLGVRIVASVAALSIVLTAAGVLFTGVGGEQVAVDTTSSVPPKGGADCGEEFSGLWGDSRGLADLTHDNVPYAAIQRNGSVAVYLNTEPCDKMGEIEYWSAMDARDNATAPQPDPVPCPDSLVALAQFNDRANGEPHRLVLVQNADGVELRFEDRCNAALGSLALP